MKKYNKTNFHAHTFCEFIEVDVVTFIDSKPHYHSKSGSMYFFLDDGVYRISNHWGRAANCRWRLISNTDNKINNGKPRVGFAKWSSFYPNNDWEKLFYIEVNLETAEVAFQHKNNPYYNGKAVLRTAPETAKVIRQIKELLETDAWAKHYTIADIPTTRDQIISLLCNSEKPLAIIKRELLEA